MMEIILQPIELTYLARLYAPQVAAEMAKHGGFPAHELEAAGVSLANRGILQIAGSEKQQIAQPLAGWISACVNPDMLIYAMRTEINGASEQTVFNLTTRLFVEDTILPTGEHRLASIPEAMLPSRVQERLCLHSELAGFGDPVTLKAVALEDALALVPLGRPGNVAAALRGNKLDAQDLQRVTDLLLSAKALGAVGWQEMRPSGQQKGLAFLDTSQGLWWLDASEDGTAVTLSPIAAQPLRDEIAGLIISAMAAVP